MKSGELVRRFRRWLSDRAKVKFIDGEGNVTLDRRDRGDGSYEIVSAAGVQNLVIVPERTGAVCFGETVYSVLGNDNLRYYMNLQNLNSGENKNH